VAVLEPLEGRPSSSEEPVQEQPDEALEDDGGDEGAWESIGNTIPPKYLHYVRADAAGGDMNVNPPYWFENGQSERGKNITRRSKSTDYDAFDERTFGSRLKPPTVKEQRRRSMLSTELRCDEQRLFSFARGTADPVVIEGIPSLLAANHLDEPPAYLRRLSSGTNLPALGKELGRRFSRDPGLEPHGEKDFDFGGEVRVF
jgi:hypothetical protein